MPINVVDLVAAAGVFFVLPSILVAGWISTRWLKLKNAELEVRRAELEVEKKKVEYLTSETNRETAEKLSLGR